MKPDFLRYSCQIALPGFSESGQRLLQNARVLVVGAGGLGSPAAQYLAAAGAGTLGIADFDRVSISNLHRQILFSPADVGQKKAVIACKRLQKQNPGIQLVTHDVRITSQNVMDIISQYDILVDGTDNFDTRYLLNDAAVIAGKPLVYGAIYQYEGQVAVWNVADDYGVRSPNYRDLFPKVDATQIPNCAEGGVIPTLAGIIGCMQANEVIKYITKTGELLVGKVLIFDTQTLHSRIIKIGDTTNTHITRLIETVITPTISVADLKKRIADNSVELIDIRTEQERRDFNIGGKHVPLYKLFSYIDTMDKDIKTVLYCASGKRSDEAVKAIKKKFPGANVFSLDGGLREWVEFSEIV
jgi:molybdopterin/thiamine biosynthesis adenylyltransferase/rhodanese-related sulfurtransferase